MECSNRFVHCIKLFNLILNQQVLFFHCQNTGYLVLHDFVENIFFRFCRAPAEGKRKLCFGGGFVVRNFREGGGAQTRDLPLWFDEPTCTVFGRERNHH